MSTTLQMPPALEEQLSAEARRQGQSPQAALQAAVQEWLRRQPSGGSVAQGSPEWNALLGSMGAGRAGVALPEDATRRETIYGDDLR